MKVLWYKDWWASEKEKHEGKSETSENATYVRREMETS